MKCTTADIEKLVTWLQAQKLLPLTNTEYYRTIFATACLPLTTEQLKHGCQAVKRAKFAKCPHPLAFKLLCLEEWEPAPVPIARAHLAEMRKAVNAAVVPRRTRHV